jgi:hypothetical protein
MLALLGLLMKDNLETKSLMARVFFNGKIIDLIRANGHVDKCMVMGSFHGQMVIDIKDNMYTVRNKEKEPSIGLMVKYL